MEKNILIIQMGGEPILDVFSIKENKVFNYYQKVVQSFNIIEYSVAWQYVNQNGQLACHRTETICHNTNSVMFQQDLNIIIEKCKRQQLDLLEREIIRKDIIFTTKLNKNYGA